MCLELPWEVIERIIEHSSDSIITLYSFTLTCRNLNPRSTILLLGHIMFKNRDQLFDLCDFLRNNPHLQPVVRGITVPPGEFSPHPLLYMLRNLSKINFAPSKTIEVSFYHPTVTFHSSVLVSCRRFGENIQSLSLERTKFHTLSTFLDILLSFPRLQTLSCSQLEIQSREEEPMARHLSKRLPGLRTLVVRPDTLSGNMIALLGEVAKHTVTSLAYSLVYPDRPMGYDWTEHEYKVNKLIGSPSLSTWIHLTSLRMGLLLSDLQSIVLDFTGTLVYLDSTNLHEVIVDLDVPSTGYIVGFLYSASRYSTECPELENELLRFSQPSIWFSLSHPLNVRKSHSWRKLIEECFPMLSRRGALVLKGGWSGKIGHDDCITTGIIISADSRWAVTGSEDNTIIIWDLETGIISQEWSARQHPTTPLTTKEHNEYIRQRLTSLGFSPDNRYVISAGLGPGVTVWDLHRGACKVTTLGDEIVKDCAWSPDGNFIVAGCGRDVDIQTVRMWDATTFHQLHSLETWNELLALSPDGRWILTKKINGVSNIWNATSGKLRRELRGHTGVIYAGAFDSDGARVVTGAGGDFDPTIRIWDVETGEESLILRVDSEGTSSRNKLAIPHQHVAFSPDGNLVLSWPPFPERMTPLIEMVIPRSGRIWDASSGALLARLDTPDRAVDSACFSPCSRYVASASMGGDALLWRARDGLCIAQVSGDGSKVDHVAITPDGRLLCCGTRDGTVLFRRMCDLVPAD